MIKLRFQRLSPYAEIPKQMSSCAAGYDLSAAVEKEVIIPAGGRFCVPTGIAIALPVGWEAQIRPRSGLAYKYGIGILNSPGTVDSDYRGEIKVILINLGEEDFSVLPGMRIAQIVIAPVAEILLEETDNLDLTERNEGGFGHTGV